MALPLNLTISGPRPHHGPLATLNVVGICATVAAAVFAAWATGQSGRHAVKASEALRRERRLDFELETLRDLSELVTGTFALAAMQYPAETLLMMLPREGLTVTRVAFSMDRDHPKPLGLRPW